MELGRDKSGLMWHQLNNADREVHFKRDPLVGVIDSGSALWEGGDETGVTAVMLVARPTIADAPPSTVYEKVIPHAVVDEDFGRIRTPFLGTRIALAQRRARRMAKRMLPGYEFGSQENV